MEINNYFYDNFQSHTDFKKNNTFYEFVTEKRTNDPLNGIILYLSKNDVFENIKIRDENNILVINHKDLLKTTNGNETVIPINFYKYGFLFSESTVITFSKNINAKIKYVHRYTDREIAKEINNDGKHKFDHKIIKPIYCFCRNFTDILILTNKNNHCESNCKPASVDSEHVFNVITDDVVISYVPGMRAQIDRNLEIVDEIYLCVNSIEDIIKIQNVSVEIGGHQFASISGKTIILNNYLFNNGKFAKFPDGQIAVPLNLKKIISFLFIPGYHYFYLYISNNVTHVRTKYEDAGKYENVVIKRNTDFKLEQKYDKYHYNIFDYHVNRWVNNFKEIFTKKLTRNHSIDYIALKFVIIHIPSVETKDVTSISLCYRNSELFSLSGTDMNVALPLFYFNKKLPNDYYIYNFTENDQIPIRVSLYDNFKLNIVVNSDEEIECDVIYVTETLLRNASGLCGLVYSR